MWIRYKRWAGIWLRGKERKDILGKIYVYKSMMWWIQLTQGMVCLGEIVYVEDTNMVVITVREVI